MIPSFLTIELTIAADDTTWEPLPLNHGHRMVAAKPQGIEIQYVDGVVASVTIRGVMFRRDGTPGTQAVRRRFTPWSSASRDGLEHLPGWAQSVVAQYQPGYGL